MSHQPSENKIMIGVVEDEVIIADSICQLLEALNYSVPEPASSYNEALELLQNHPVDLMLLDINLSNGKNGIELAGYIRSHYKIPIIFLTANSDKDTIYKAREVNPDAYLVKPFVKADLYAAIEIALYNYLKKDKQPVLPPAHQPEHLLQENLFIKEGNVMHKVHIKDILYISSDHVYVNLHTSERKYMVRAGLQQYLDKFPPGNFIRVHRSYAVNMAHIDKINVAYIIIGNEQIPISKNYRDEVRAYLKLD